MMAVAMVLVMAAGMIGELFENQGTISTVSEVHAEETDTIYTTENRYYQYRILDKEKKTIEIVKGVEGGLMLKIVEGKAVLNIPSELEGYTVVSLGGEAFANMIKIALKKQMKKKKYLKWWIAAVSAVFIVGAGIFVYTQYKAAQTSGDVATKDGTSASASDITWNGKTYSYNEHLSNFLFLGIDTKEKAETKTGQADAGQADALYLLSWNRLEGDITVISIPRDTMTQIETFGPGGKSLGKSKDHISLSYAYGDGGYESCELAENAVSELLYGLPIDGYCALNMDGLPVLTDSVGGVTVTVPNDSLAEVDPGYAKGAVVTLKGEDTEQFVRYRNTEISQSAIARMERQQEYIRAFGEALKKASADKALVTDLYKAIEPYMVTNMGKSRFVDLTESVSEGKKVNRWTIPGEGIQGKEYDEYVVDDDALYEKTVETFYVEKK